MECFLGLVYLAFKISFLELEVLFCHLSSKLFFADSLLQKQNFRLFKHDISLKITDLLVSLLELFSYIVNLFLRCILKYDLHSLVQHYSLCLLVVTTCVRLLASSSHL